MSAERFIVYRYRLLWVVKRTEVTFEVFTDDNSFRMGPVGLLRGIPGRLTWIILYSPDSTYNTYTCVLSPVPLIVKDNESVGTRKKLLVPTTIVNILCASAG